MTDTASSTPDDLYKHKEGSFQRLTSNNYATWSQNCQRLLLSLGVWKIVDNTEARPEDPGGNPAHQAQRIYEERLSEFDRRYHKAANVIYNSVSADIRPYINTTFDPANMWTILRQRSSQVGSAMQRTALHIRFQQMAPKPGAPISQFFTSLLDIRNQLSGTQQAIDDTMIKARIFATAPPEFETTSIYQQNLPEDTPLETIMDAFKRDESIRALRTDPPALKDALYSNTSNFRGRGNGRGRGGCGRGGRWTQSTKWCTTASAILTPPKNAGPRNDHMMMTMTMTMILTRIRKPRSAGTVENLDTHSETALSVKKVNKQQGNLRSREPRAQVPKPLDVSKMQM